MSKQMLLLAVSALAIVLVVGAVSGCTTTSTPTPGTGTSTVTSTPTSTPASTSPGTPATAVTGAPTISTAGNTITIAGSQDGTVEPQLETGGYIVEILYKEEVEVDAGNYFIQATANMFPARPDGWHLSISPANIQGGNPLKIKASSPYRITLTKLPLAATPDTTPKTYKGTGSTVVGPITLNQGTVTLKGVSGEVKAQLYDATTGIFVSFDRSLYTTDGPAEITEDVPQDGSYLIHVIDKKYSDWEFTVSQ
ncbi:hypothetical protein [Methanocella sp. MCL-LM]|uniref:hypothetical protein n=1 Tax=Methanocella sp. MCL-LM TaxID=3412035 RepID=UPI003C710476